MKIENRAVTDLRQELDRVDRDASKAAYHADNLRAEMSGLRMRGEQLKKDGVTENGESMITQARAMMPEYNEARKTAKELGARRLWLLEQIHAQSDPKSPHYVGYMPANFEQEAK